MASVSIREFGSVKGFRLNFAELFFAWGSFNKRGFYKMLFFKVYSLLLSMSLYLLLFSSIEKGEEDRFYKGKWPNEL
jgi:hypothetical protein